jgi:ElaB/YqjD/DUF883 family membrane-anchored ribosome-binding protein
MGQTPEELRQDIERTRRELRDDVDALNEKVSPSAVMRRRTEAARGRFVRVRESVMGSANSGTSRLSHSSSSMTSSAGDAITGAPDAAMRHTEGNPLAAGLIAFAGGWLVGSLLPATQAEQEAAQKVQSRASDMAGPVKEEATQVAQEMKENLREPARQAVDEVKHSAAESRDTVSAESQAAGQAVAEESRSSAERVQSRDR